MLGLLLLLLAGVRWSGEWVGLDEVVAVLVSAAVACAATAAILAAVVHRLTPDPRAVWLSSAFTVYGAVGVPVAAVAATWQTHGAVLDALRFTGHLLAVLLLLVAAMPPVPRPVTGPMRMSALAGLVVVLGGALAWAAPGVTVAVTGNGVARSVVGGLGLLGGFALIMAGLAQRSPIVARVGMGAGMVAIAHLAKIWSEHAQLVNPALAVASLRLFGLLVVVLGLVQLARRAFGDVHGVELARREELRLARMGLARAAERDHELRTGLAGLAGATHLFDHVGDDADQPEEVLGLRTAMSSELARLESMLAPGDPAATRDPSPAYPLAPVVADLVTLRNCAGMEVRCDVEPWLWVEGSPGVLRQVLCNLLANCARHAPGSPVRVQAFRYGSRIRLRVSDFGPGLAAGSEQAVFQRGTRSRTTGGQGLGLHICRELLKAEGGTIEVQPVSATRPGCTVIIELPRARGLHVRTEPVAVPNIR
ncbi:MAG: sensor histidine kinase [Pseudonocardia sp.]